MGGKGKGKANRPNTTTPVPPADSAEDSELDEDSDNGEPAQKKMLMPRLESVDSDDEEREEPANSAIANDFATMNVVKQEGQSQFVVQC